MTGPGHPEPAGGTDRMREGWIVLPLLSTDAFAEMRLAVRHMHNQQPDAALWQSWAVLVTKSNAMPGLKPFTQGLRLVSASTTRPTASPWQQLRCLTDEAAHRAYRLWMPLEAAVLTLVPRSHRWSNALRGEGLPSIWRGLHAGFDGLATKVLVAPGSAVLFDRALLHRLPDVAGIVFDWVAEAAPLRRYLHDPRQADTELIACYSSTPEMLGEQDGLLGHLRQNLNPVRPQDLQALRMGILPAIFRPIQDPNLLQSIPKTPKGPSKS